MWSCFVFCCCVANHCPRGAPEGDLGSERALQEVAALLEKEVARGAITPEVEKKVLGEQTIPHIVISSSSTNIIAPGGVVEQNENVFYFHRLCVHHLLNTLLKAASSSFPSCWSTYAFYYHYFHNSLYLFQTWW